MLVLDPIKKKRRNKTLCAKSHDGVGCWNPTRSVFPWEVAVMSHMKITQTDILRFSELYALISYLFSRCLLLVWFCVTKIIFELLDFVKLF